MDFSKIIEIRNARSSRSAVPFRVFYAASSQCIAAGRELTQETVETNHTRLLERSVVITFVTHVEVYFKDMLDAIFRQCDPDFFRPKLRHLHNQKYGIDELLEIYERQIHPLELISGDVSFQSTASIDRVFSKFLGAGLWDTAINTRIRLPNQPKTEIKFEAEYLRCLERTFELRHNLVHNPSDAPHITDSVMNDIDFAQGLMLAADIVLLNMLAEHRDPQLETETQ
ncbi:MAG: hypothetical protein AB3N19_12120 [Ruegeria sp.]